MRAAVGTQNRADTWISVAIVALAFALRVAWLGWKPPHFDEGVNGWFLDEMTRTGRFAYDPTNFHGPLHFYVLFLSQTLFGRGLWELRMPLVLVSTACVAMLLAFRAHFGARVCQIAALAMAVSPGFIFYGRYAIHETELVFFLILLAWGLAGLWRSGERRHLWAAALGATGAVLTKETYVVHLVALALAVPCVVFYETMSASAPLRIAMQRWTRRDAWNVGAVCAVLIVFFYSGGLLHWESLPGLWLTFAPWLATGMKGETGHEKEWFYWLQLMGRYEWPACVGLLASWGLLMPRTSRMARYFAAAGLGALIVYSGISYKTPWCVMSLMWPFYFTFGLAVVWMAQRVDRWVAGGVAACLLAGSLGLALDLNFRKPTDEREPYVYVQTTNEVEKLLGPLRTLASRDARNYHLIGSVILPDTHPLIWQLGDFTRVNFPTIDDLPEPLDAEFLLIDLPLVEQLEPKLRDIYFKDTMHIRGQSDQTAALYLRAVTFAEFFPGRVPELGMKEAAE